MARFDTCFIVAPAGANTTKLRRQLERREISVRTEFQSPPGDPILESTVAAIRSADFVCVLLPFDFPTSNAYIEFGIALAYGKPVVAFIDPRIDVPSSISRLQYARSDLDTESLELHLDAFLRHGKPSGRTGTRGRPTTGQTIAANVAASARDELEIIRRFRGVEGGRRLEALVDSLFRNAGFIVEGFGRPTNVGADLAVWLDSSSEVLSNPLLVDMKLGDFSDARLTQVESSLNNYLYTLGPSAGTGLIVYLNRSGRKLGRKSPDWPRILRISAEDLIDDLAMGHLEQTLMSKSAGLAHR